MKGLILLSVFAFLYVFIIIIFNEAIAEPRGVETDKNVVQPGWASAQPPPSIKKDHGTDGREGTKNASNTHTPSVPVDKIGKVSGSKSPSHHKGSDASVKHAQQRAAGSGLQGNDSNPLADLFQIGDPTMRATLGAVYGAYRGNDQCSRKAFCMLGNYMKDMPGRDLAFLFMGNYIPTEYSLYYEIFKIAVMYGQNCEVYVCIPDSGPPDAASAASRPSPIPATTTTTSTTTTSRPQNSQQQRPNTWPNSDSLDNAFGNAIPR